LLSLVTEPDGDVLYIHADTAGIEQLEKLVEYLKREVQAGECPHSHLFSEAWGGGELTETMLAQEKSESCKQVHHVKVYGWTNEWASRHGLV
jgi:hypothetical protein